MTSIYNTGTVTVTNGSAAVVGTGTGWAVSLVTGGTLNIEATGNPMPIAAVTDNTHLTGAVKWTGASGTYSYAIVREDSDAANVVDLYDKLSRVLVTLSLAGVHPNASGTLTERDAISLTTDDEGFFFLRAELGVAFAFYRWTGSAWDGPFDASGPQGVPGVGTGGFGLPPGGTTGQIAKKASGTDGDVTWADTREVLTANRIYYVGYNLGSASVSIASPTVVTKAAHGLIAGSRVSFSILPNTKSATISVAAPAVVTMANSFAAGQPVIFASTGRLPAGIVAGTTYYVIAAGLSGASFQISATIGGAVINTSNPVVTISQASPGVVTEAAHGRSVGDAIQFATTGALPSGLATATTYFVKAVINANTYNVSATPEGAAINTSSAGAGIHTVVQFGSHYLSETGTLPTGITAGQDYFVLGAGLTSGTFQFSATSGGAAVNTSGSTTGTIVIRTGSDNNDGLDYTRSGALMTLQAAVNKAALIDLSTFNCMILVDSGVYAGAFAKNIVGSGTVFIRGKNLDLFSATIGMTTGGAVLDACFNGYDGFQGIYKCEYVTMAPTGSGTGIYANNGTVFFGNINFKNGGSTLFNTGVGGFIQATENYMVSGGVASAHMASYDGGQIRVQGRTITLLDAPSSVFAIASRVGTILANSNTFNGLGKGARYSVALNGILYTGSGSANYFPGSIAGTAGTGGQYQ